MLKAAFRPLALAAAVIGASCEAVMAAEDAAAKPELSFPSKMNVFTTEETVKFEVPSVSSGGLSVRDGLGRSSVSQAGVQGAREFGKLPPGFYKIMDGARELGCFVVVVPAAQYPNDGNTAIGLDYAMNTAGFKLKAEELKSELERNAAMALKAGVKRVRERLRTTGKNGELARGKDGSFSIDEEGLTSLCLKIGHAAGFKICAVAQVTPQELNIEGNPKRVPSLLANSYAIYEAIGRSWGKYLEGVEIGNEIDLRYFYEGTAGEYAAYCKAASLALRKASPGILVVHSSFARPALRMKAALAENGLAPYFDVFNYHVYGEVGAGMNDYAKYIISNSPCPRVWCTETGKEVGGWNWTLPGTLDFPEALSSLAARGVGPVYAENLAAGAEKTYFFYWRYGAELSLGSILDKSFMATERYAALATVNRMLGNAVYRGSLTPGNVRAHLFDDGSGRRCLIAWSSEGASKLALKARGAYEVVRHSGETLSSGRSDGGISVELSEFAPVYVRAESFDDAFADLRCKMPEAPAVSGSPSPLVVELRPEGGLDYDQSLAAFSVPPGQAQKLRLTVSNFGETEHHGEVKLDIPGPWQLSPKSFSVDLKPSQTFEAETLLTAPDVRSEGRLLKSISAEARGAAPASIQFALSAKDVIPKRVEPAFKSLSSGVWIWKHDVAAAGFRSEPSAEGFRFVISFDRPGPRMFWPVLESLPDGRKSLDWSGWDAVRVKIKVKETRPGTWFMLYATETKGARYGSSRIVADTPGEHELFFPFSCFSYLTEDSAQDAPEFSFDLDKIRTFGLGSGNLRSKELKDEAYKVDYEITAIDLLKY